MAAGQMLAERRVTVGRAREVSRFNTLPEQTTAGGKALHCTSVGSIIRTPRVSYCPSNERRMREREMKEEERQRLRGTERD